MKKIRVAVIGYGRSGRDIHKHLLEHLPEQYALAGFVDQDPQRRAMIRRETGLEAMRDYTELFCRQAEIDLVVNASFTQDHARISKALLEQGFSVLSDKPAAKTVEAFVCLLESAA